MRVAAAGCWGSVCLGWGSLGPIFMAFEHWVVGIVSAWAASYMRTGKRSIRVVKGLNVHLARWAAADRHVRLCASLVPPCGQGVSASVTSVLGESARGVSWGGGFGRDMGKSSRGGCVTQAWPSPPYAFARLGTGLGAFAGLQRTGALSRVFRGALSVPRAARGSSSCHS